MISVRQKKIFIFIKDDLLSETLTPLLRDNSFDVSTFKSVSDFIEKLSKQKPDLILFDYVFKANESDKEISTFYVELMTSFSNIPLILMYATETSDNVKKLFNKTHPDAMLKKPFKQMELLDKTNRALYSGTLEKTPFLEIIQTFYEEKRTGVLHITVESTKYFVYFLEGQIVYIEYGLRKDTLGMLLIRQEKITEEQYNEALQEAAKSRSRLGVSLIKLGLLTPSELNIALEHQVNEKIMSCFAEKVGTFSFNFQDRFIDDIVIYMQDTEKVIFEGIKRHYSEKRMSEFLDMIKTKKFIIDRGMVDMLDVFRFETEERIIISNLKTTRTYDELSKMQGVDTLLLSRILYTLFVTRYLVVADKDATVQEIKAPGKADIKVTAKEKHETVEESGDIKSMVYATYVKIKSMNYYEILDIPRDADTDKIKTAYKALVKKFYPDKFSGQKDPDVSQKAAEIYTKLSHAYNVLIDDTMKKEYDNKLDHPKEAEHLETSNEIIESEMEFLKGSKLLKQKEFKNAEHSFGVAMQINPKEPEYKCYYAWAHFLNSENDKNEKAAFAKKLINEALSVNDNIDMAYFFLGSIAKLEGDLPLAISNFKKALQLNPDNAQVNEMMKVINFEGEK